MKSVKKKNEEKKKRVLSNARKSPNFGRSRQGGGLKSKELRAK